jgi:hypothetical protein
MDIEQVKSELRKEVRALKLDEKLKGYMVVMSLEDVPEEDARQALTYRVIRMTDPALKAVSERTGYAFRGASEDVLRVLAEEAHRVIEQIERVDANMLGQAVELVSALAGPVN